MNHDHCSSHLVGNMTIKNCYVEFQLSAVVNHNWQWKHILTTQKHSLTTISCPSPVMSTINNYQHLLTSLLSFMSRWFSRQFTSDHWLPKSRELRPARGVVLRKWIQWCTLRSAVNSILCNTVAVGLGLQQREKVWTQEDCQWIVATFSEWFWAQWIILAISRIKEGNCRVLFLTVSDQLGMLRVRIFLGSFQFAERGRQPVLHLVARGSPFVLFASHVEPVP